MVATPAGARFHSSPTYRSAAAPPRSYQRPHRDPAIRAICETEFWFAEERLTAFGRSVTVPVHGRIPAPGSGDDRMQIRKCVARGERIVVLSAGAGQVRAC